MIGESRIFVPAFICELAFCSILGFPLKGAARQEKPPTQNAEAAVKNDKQRISSIRIISDEGAALAENSAQIPLKPGDALDAEALRETLRMLYRTGEYADLRAETSPEGDAVRLDIVVKQNYFVNLVRIEGLQEPPTEGVALASLRLTAGEIFRPRDVEAALERLRETLREDGLYQARVSASFSPHPDTRQMDILIHADPGPRARLEKITFRNHTEFSNDAIEDRSHLRPGGQVTSGSFKKAAERIRGFLVRKNHLSARVSLRRGEYNPATNRLPLEIEVSAGPRVRVNVKGARISQRELKKILPIYAEGAVDEDLLVEGRRAIQDRLERDSYFDSQVEYETTEIQAPAAKESAKGAAPPELVIAYTVDRGIRHRLAGIAFEGHHYFSDELLRGRLQLQPSSFTAKSRFGKKLAQSDANGIRDLYVANGFRDAQVSSDIVDDYGGKKGDIFVRFVIQEGPQTRVAALKIAGNRAIGEDELLAVTGSTPGQPFSEFAVSGDRDNILALYYNEGFPEARFTAKVDESPPDSAAGEASGSKADASATAKKETAQNRQPEKPKVQQTVRLTYQIEEGPRSIVRRVLVGGNVRTKPGVIWREVQVKPGPLRHSDVVETQRRLYNLGVFSRVTVVPQNPSGSAADKNVVVLVDEGQRYTLGYGGGIEVQRLASRTVASSTTLQASPRIILEVTKNNLTGRADTLSFKVRASTLQGRALVSYATPNYFGRPQFSFQATAYADRTRDINTFTASRYEGSLQLAQKVSPFTSLIYRYSFRKVLVTSISSSLSPEVIPLVSQPTLVSGFGLTWLRDHRDNPAEASRGRFYNFDVSVNSTSIGSSASFARVFFQNSTFHRVAKNYTFARSIRVGVLHPFQGTISLLFPTPTVAPLPRVIPLPERFFAGGGTTLRSFALNQAGPRDPKTGFPVGGQALLIFNQELRFPMRLPYLGSRLGGALFYDAGNVYSRASRISFRWRAPRPVFDPANPKTCLANCTNELNYLSHTIGLGFRYATPIGPVRVDIGYQLNPPTFAIDCTGKPASCQPSARLSRLQIFFNLGSIF